MTPKISIITRTRNRPSLLIRARESVLCQVGAPEWEWIIVNDAGDPQSVKDVIAPAQQRYPECIHVLHLTESKGMEHASNQGMRLARGQFAVIHDDDDSWLPTFLAKMTAYMEAPQNATAAGVVCQSWLIHETILPDSIEESSCEPFNPWLEQIDLWRLIQENTFPPISFLFRRAIWERLGGFDESLPVLGDWEFNVRIALQQTIAFLPERLARYHHRLQTTDPSQANSVTAGDQLHRKWEQILRQRWTQSPPLPEFPLFGELSRIACAHLAISRSLQRLKSLPLRPGVQ
jgi:glycosyltransferase involved in cell wall biosynthesis